MKPNLNKIAAYISGNYHFHIFQFENKILNIYGKIKNFNEKTGKLTVENSSKIKSYPENTKLSLIQKDIITISKNPIIQEVI